MDTVSDHTILNCPLCYTTFTTPRVLPCFHTFCESCLVTHIESTVQSGSKFACPLCAAKTFPSDSNLAVKKWASKFPLNMLLYSLIESSLDVDDGDDKCEPCKADEEIKIAEFWCVDCQERLCSSCNRLHRRGKLLKYHNVVPIHERDQHKQSNLMFDQQCSRHDVKVNFFCVDHRKLCCADCVATDHRQCNDVRSIDDIARDQSQRSTSDYPNIIRDIKNLKTEVQKMVTEKKRNATNILREKDQIVHDMDNKIDRIINVMNKLRNIFKKEADQLYKDTENFILKKEKTLQSFLTNIENSREIMEVVESTGTPQQKFTTFENIRSQIASHYDELKSYLTDDVEMHFSVKSDKFLDDIEGSMNSLGSVDATSTSSAKLRDALQNANKIMKNLNSHTNISTEMCSAQVEKAEELMITPVTFVRAVKRDILGCWTWFTGGTYLSDGRLVMCDHHNQRLVELDDEYNIVKEYEVKGKPTVVATGNKNNEIYIAVSKYIYKCTLNTVLTIVSRISAPSSTWGIVVSDANIIVSTSNAVVILSQNGSTVESIPKSGDHSYVAVSQTQHEIYHKDEDDVVCRTWEGHEVFRYQHQQLKYPCGIFTDKFNNVYICGAYSYNVHQISSDRHRSRIILDKLHNISRPWSAMLHPLKNQLIVTSFNENTVLEIYKLG